MYCSFKKLLVYCARMAELYSSCVYYVHEYIYVCVSSLSPPSSPLCFLTKLPNFLELVFMYRYKPIIQKKIWQLCVCVCVQDFILCLPPFLSLCLLIGIALSPSSSQFRDIYTSLIVKKRINDIVFNYKVFNRYFLLDEIKKYNMYLPLIFALSNQHLNCRINNRR